MTVFSSTISNPIIPSTNNYIRITLDANNNNITLTYPQSFIPRKDYMAPFIEVYVDTGFTTGTIRFDDTALTSFGNGCIISNIGSEAINVEDYNANVIVSIPSSMQYVLFIGQDANGDAEWRSYLLGAGTSSADANALAGYGLTAFIGKLSTSIQTENSDVSVTINDASNGSLNNWTGSNVEIELVPSDISLAGFHFYFRNSSTTDGIVTFTPTEGSTIDGSTSLIMNAGQSSIIIYDDSSTPKSWKTVGLGIFGSSTGGRITQYGFAAVDGSALHPSYSFIDWPQLGFFTESGTDVSFTSGGIKQLKFDNEGINLEETNIYRQNGDDILYLFGIYP
jgi:hypothetical protein